ncbi:MAG: replication initiation protein [Mitsuokella sp.]|uniref:replication initiation protein n=1 Tax=Mitsuokella sp. TaxID=2049034 RepID=UPI003F04A006
MNDRRPVIYQANPLIEAKKAMNALEMRLFLLALQDINPHLGRNDKFYDKDFPATHISPSQVKEILGNGMYLTLLDKTCDSLAKRVLVLRSEEGMKYVPLFAVIEYEKRDGLRIKFNNEMRPYLLDIFELGKGYTRIAMKQIFNLSSAYSMRLLELMLQYQGLMHDKTIQRHIELGDLRFMLNVGEHTYTRIQDFCRRVLDDPIKEINEKTQYRISYTKVRKARRIMGFNFTMDCSQVMPDEEAAETVQMEMLPNRNEWHGLTRQSVDKLTLLCGSNEEFEKRMGYAVELAKTRKVKNVPAFLYKAIAENYLRQDQDMKAAIEREFKAKQENAAWELDAIKMFGDEISLDVEETPFDQSDDMGRAMVSVVRKALKERHLNVTAKRLLEDHGMSVARFIELYCQDETSAKK